MKGIKLVAIILVLLLVLFLGVQIFGFGFRDREQVLRNHIQEICVQWFPLAAAKSQRLYGVKPLGNVDGGEHRILLIHGLDEPGLVWNQLAPVLMKNGYDVWTFTYPNDGRVEKAAQFLLDELIHGLPRDGKKLIFIAHSMGGLVARSLLSDPLLEANQKKERIPGISRLIMVGTPNHGSQMVRFRWITEIRDQVWHWMHTRVSLFHPLLDGAGAAGVDLLPGSLFLSTLNGKTHYPGVESVVIAGEWAGFFPDKMDGWRDVIGDGLVSISSASLGDTPLIRVPGGHLSMIRNYFWQNDRIPPAIPVILSILQKR